MTYVLIGGAALVALMVLYQMFRTVSARKIARFARWLVGGGLAALTAFLLFRGQVGIASITGPVAFMILRFGRIGRFSFEGTTPGENNRSSVKSRYVAMTLDHDSGTIEGRVIAGRFKGRNLIDLDEIQTRQLLAEAGADPDSLALLETWLDKNRPGWRESFAEQEGAAASGAQQQGGALAPDPDAEAYAVLGLRPGATAEEVRAAHRKLMMGVHPDQGGSTYLAAKINAAKDRLLKTLGER
ncbi:MAG TPA: DnaJ domain-containing protein [Alphaproteobacteria bacterium]|nr:DnaJ domain-containing protein [Alphaproteobacteria bacterium]